jgi:hypothetical protein
MWLYGLHLIHKIWMSIELTGLLTQVHTISFPKLLMPFRVLLVSRICTASSRYKGRPKCTFRCRKHRSCFDHLLSGTRASNERTPLQWVARLETISFVWTILEWSTGIESGTWRCVVWYIVTNIWELAVSIFRVKGLVTIYQTADRLRRQKIHSHRRKDCRFLLYCVFTLQWLRVVWYVQHFENTVGICQIEMVPISWSRRPEYFRRGAVSFPRRRGSCSQKILLKNLVKCSRLFPQIALEYSW